MAKRLAKGHLGSRKAVLYVIDVPGEVPLAQILKQNLAKIGLDAEIMRIPPSAYFDRIGTRGEPFDIAWGAWGPDYLDPYTYINTLLHGSPIGDYNYSRFDSRKYNRLMDRAAGLRGKARSRAYGNLDIALASHAAPLIAYAFANEPTLVSKRVRCRVLRPWLDLAAACLK